MAQEWYLKAATSKMKDPSLSSREAQYRLGMVEKEKEKGTKEKAKEEAMENGISIFTSFLGLLHDPDVSSGEDSFHAYAVARSYENAYQWYLKAAKGGHEDSEYNTALLLGEGKGVGVDRQKAISFLKSAAGKGHVNAMYQLGVMLDEDKRFEEAIEQYKRTLDACKRNPGHEEVKKMAQEALDELQEELRKRQQQIQQHMQVSIFCPLSLLNAMV